MASINGITLKGIKHFLGTDGYGLNANIYMDGKKIGSCIDSGDGGCWSYDFTSPDKEDEFAKRVHAYFSVPRLDTVALYRMHCDNAMYKKLEKEGKLPMTTETYDDYDIILSQVESLVDTEKVFKKMLKKGDYDNLYCLEFESILAPVPRDDTYYVSSKRAKTACAKLLADAKAINATATGKLYTDLKDFDIQVGTY